APTSCAQRAESGRPLRRARLRWAERRGKTWGAGMSVPKDPPDYGYYPERMRPVPFPTGGAQAAIDACDRIAALLESDLGARPGLVARARDGWEGAYRGEFDETVRTQEIRLL